MKVLDLSCLSGHVFEGWFGSEDDFLSQLARGLVQCPVCGSSSVHKKLSAPRLNLSRAKAPDDSASAISPSFAKSAPSGASLTPPMSEEMQAELQTALAKVVQHVLASTVDVGDRFAEEARRIHYGEKEERAIRGQATADEARELVEEGIELMAIPIPAHLKNPLQ
ncbi:DUF1178 family protein [Rhodoferax sp. TBRC 17660]|uniref:DUF1178 family protein n=1 Tax=Rhodoferax potami TaxID=3068338 RepID=A0ABU3KJ21_9BURK|nr:DUF1178 family protein [Rhodoferax sp. TBRC 17660]MDT7517774.1 DUF1178 family protein [Rhodoferax sp. TBRC 17660]